MNQSGWNRAQHAVVLRRRISHDIALPAETSRRNKEKAEQPVLALPIDEVQDHVQFWDCAKLATNAQ